MSIGVVLVVVLIILIILIIILLSAWPTYIKPKAMKYATKKIMENLPKQENPAELNINEPRTCGKISYFHQNKKYDLYLPYDKKLLRKVGYSVFHELDGKKVEITQEPGLPYLVTPKMLGGGEVKVYKDEELKITFKEDEHIKF